jgi:hypothetical protein
MASSSQVSENHLESSEQRAGMELSYGRYQGYLKKGQGCIDLYRQYLYNPESLSFRLCNVGFV